MRATPDMDQVEPGPFACMTNPGSVGPALRPQVEQFVGCLAMTGQEAPSQSRKLQEDLFKKCLSGDGISGPPTAARTAQVHGLGWYNVCGEASGRKHSHAAGSDWLSPSGHV
jgi:hypothetical protein